MNLIEQLGGYTKAKECINTPTARECIKNELRDALLQYRRENNIFEVEDLVVSINKAYIDYPSVLTINHISRFDLMLSDDCKGFDVNAICGWERIIRHATPQEIVQGYLDE